MSGPASSHARRLATALGALLAVLGSASTRADAHRDAGSDPGPLLFAQRCAQCHGATGGGDGLGALGLNPRPRALRDPAWQASVSDEQLATAIVSGGAAVGKSPLMAANPDLSGQPEQLAALVRFVRSLKKETR